MYFVGSDGLKGCLSAIADLKISGLWPIIVLLRHFRLNGIAPQGSVVLAQGESLMPACFDVLGVQLGTTKDDQRVYFEPGKPPYSGPWKNGESPRNTYQNRIQTGLSGQGVRTPNYITTSGQALPVTVQFKSDWIQQVHAHGGNKKVLADKSKELAAWLLRFGLPTREDGKPCSLVLQQDGRGYETTVNPSVQHGGIAQTGNALRNAMSEYLGLDNAELELFLPGLKTVTDGDVSLFWDQESVLSPEECHEILIEQYPPESSARKGDPESYQVSPNLEEAGILIHETPLTESFEEFLESFDRESLRQKVDQGEQERSEMLRLFPLDGWSTMKLEQYAVGLPDPDNYCRWLEFRSKSLGGVGGGSAKKWRIYKHKKKPGFYFPAAKFNNVQDAWGDLRTGFVQMFAHASNEEWARIQELDAFGNAKMLRLKSLHIYYPREILPIYSPKHLCYLLDQLGVSSDSIPKSPVLQNRKLLERVKGIPLLKDWSTLEMAGALYRWRNPKSAETGGGSMTPVEEVTTKNHILYGPPGTGKTYSTTELALNICGVEYESDTALDEYRRLVDQQRIFFITFHQSFSYEDFVEGIRAVTDEESGQIRYETRDGVFKDACSRALALIAEEARPVDVDLDGASYWKVSLGDTLGFRGDQLFEQCLEQNQIAVGYGRSLDFSDCKTRDEVRKKFEDVPGVDSITDHEVTVIHYLYNEMKVGDLVIVPDGNLKFRGIAKVIGEASRSLETGLQTRPVEWLRVYPEKSQPVEFLLRKNFSQKALYPLRPSTLKIENLRVALAGNSSTSDGDNRNCVLIVDEINRANVSKVLGELITLLEPDKRLGAANEKRVILPYSRERFGVPPNLFLVGTMNTADRSIASLDVALRRRFSFKELMPDYELVEEYTDSLEVSVSAILRRMNERIEVLLDRDHTIGHAYFLEVSTLDDLSTVFLEKVIPLLQEYFFLDWRKICLVLGCGVDEQGKSTCPAPIVIVRTHEVSKLFGANFDEFEDSLTFEVNPEFAAAEGKVLVPFFEGILANGS